MIKNVVKKIPFSIACYEITFRLLNSRSNKKVLAQLEKIGSPEASKIVAVLRSLGSGLSAEDNEWKTKIEGQRQQLMRRNNQLNSGDLGEAEFDNELTVKEACLVSKPPKQALLLYLLTRVFRPKRVLELGTNLGISSAYIGAAINANHDNGCLLTLDISPYRQRLAKEIHHNLAIENIEYIQGIFSDTLKPALDRLQTVDLVFIDGHHQYQPTLDYFDLISNYSTPRTVFVFDDIRWSSGMQNAWAEIQNDERLGLVVDLQTVGLAIPLEDRTQRFVSDPYYLI